MVDSTAALGYGELLAVLNVCYQKESGALSREQVREALQERSVSGLNLAEDCRTEGSLDAVGRLSQWCLPLGSANTLGQKRESGYT